jgi:O-methyltransferase
MATWLKVLPFLDDPRFLEIAGRHEALLPIPNWHWNLQTVLWAARQVENVPGDFVELGVFRGHTTLFLADYLEFAKLPRQWRLYDTFEGIPSDQLDPEWAERNEQTYVGTYSLDEVRKRFEAFPNIEVIKGRVPEVLQGEDMSGQIAFLHMDLNSSTAEIAALDLLFDRIPRGGVIVFDDYCWAASRAQHDAEKAWFEARNLHILPLPTGQGLFIKP